MDRANDEARLLRSPSDSDLEDFETPDVINPQPYGGSAVDFADDFHRSSLGSRLPEYKYRAQLAVNRFRNGGFSLRHTSKWFGLSMAFLLAFILGIVFAPAKNSAVEKWMNIHESSKWVKPEGVKIVGFVFYGRPQYVTMLDCYLKRNLAVNGGFLDEVHWVANSKNEYDLKYLDVLVNSSSSYKKFTAINKKGEMDYGAVWDIVNENNTLYIKIDDDMLYVHDDAIPRLVQTRLKYPEAFAVTANIINSPITNWFHHRTNAIYPYLPESKPPHILNSSLHKATWRASELPAYIDDAPDSFDFGEKEGDHFRVGEVGGPPFKGHRWLPLKNTPANLLKTPIEKSEYGSWGRGWHSWAIAAQQHYSFFENLERNQMHKYWWGSQDGIWNMQYERYNINFMAIWGRDVKLEKARGDDEGEFSVDFPRKYKRPLIIDTHALVAHYAFNVQEFEMTYTDILDRYRAYANEMICEADHQLKPMELHYR